MFSVAQVVWGYMSRLSDGNYAPPHMSPIEAALLRIDVRYKWRQIESD